MLLGRSVKERGRAGPLGRPHFFEVSRSEAARPAVAPYLPDQSVLAKWLSEYG